jgi:predicted metal-dependent peptidase
MLADRTIVMTADAKVHEIAEIGKFDEIFNAVKFKGGGGTDFRPAFNKIAKLGLCPNLLVYFTDGYGTFPETAPDYPVLWAFTKEHSPAPWGESVTIQA